MRTKTVQMSLSDINDGVLNSTWQKKPALIQLLEEHIDFNHLIPIQFISAFYKNMGRKHILFCTIAAFYLQSSFGLDSMLLLIYLSAKTTYLLNTPLFA